jgi:hypothetical protein
MKYSFRLFTFLMIVFCLFGSAANAQEKKTPMKPGTKTQNKKVAPAHTPFNAKARFPLPLQYLIKFSGKWSADAVFVKEGKTYNVKYQVIARAVAEGNGILVEESFNDSTLGNMRGTSLASYDSLDSKVHWYTVSNDGVPHEHTGSWSSPDSFYMEHKSVRKGKTYTEKIHFAFKGRDELSFSFVATLDGKETERATAVFNRQMPPVKKEMNAAPAPEKKE